MSQTVSNTINVAVNLEGADDVVVKAQETAKTLDAVAESSQAVQTATINEVAQARSRSGAALEAEKKATVAAFAEIGAAVEENAKRETAAINAVAEAGADGEKKRRDAANANVESWTKVGNAVESAAAKVPRWAKALGATVDAQGLLVNSLGRCVAELNKSQVAAGEWVDELGRVRDANGGFVDGLTKIQKALGFFKDEAGNVRDRLGEIVVAAKKATDATGELESAIPDDSFDELVEGLDGAAQWFSQVGTVLTTLDGEASGAAFAGAFEPSVARREKRLGRRIFAFKQVRRQNRLRFRAEWDSFAVGGVAAWSPTKTVGST